METPTQPGNESPTTPPVAVTVEPVPAPPAAVEESEFIRLPAGIELNHIQAQAISAGRPVRFIVLAGAADSGKTTLLTSVYELFQSGPVEKKRFAGCETFPAFEKRCHLSRTDSENEEPDTARTPYAGPQPEYLHVTVDQCVAGSGHIDFLFTDVSGEMFEHARNSTDECKRLTFLRLASHFVVFLDGQKAVQAEKRWGMVQDAKSLLQSCLDSNMLDHACFVTVVWAKCDYFEVTKEKVALSAFIKSVEDDFKTSFGTRIPSLKFHRAAARPTKSRKLKLGHGVTDLLMDWINNWPQARKMRLEPPTDNGGTRESELFAKRNNG